MCHNSPLNEFLLLFCGLLGSSFLRRSFLGCVARCRAFSSRLQPRTCFCFRFRLSLLGLHSLLRQFRRAELLPIERNLGDPYRREILPVSTELLVLLLALVMENQNLCAPALFDNLAGHARTRCWHGYLALAAGNRQHVAEFNLAVCVSLRFQPNHVSGRHPVLFATGADDRVHTHASTKNSSLRAIARQGNSC